MTKKYSQEELLRISKALDAEDKEHIQEIYIKRLQTFIEEVFIGIDQRLREIERNQEEFKKLLSNVPPTTREEIITFRKVSRKKAKSLVRNYVTDHPGRLTSQVIEDLNLDPESVVEILNELAREGTVKGDIGTRKR